MRTPDALFGIKRPSIGPGNPPGGVPSILRYSFGKDSSMSATPTPSPISRNAHLNLNTQTPNSTQQVIPSNTSPNISQSTAMQPPPASIISNHGSLSKSSSGTPLPPQVKTEHPPPPIGTRGSWGDIGQTYRSNLHPALQAHIRKEMVRRQHIHAEEMKAYEKRLKNTTSSETPVPPSASNTSALTEGFQNPYITTTRQSVITSPVSGAEQNLPEIGASQTTRTPKRTYVPPPRPWETLRKGQQPGTTPSPNAISNTATMPAAAGITLVNHTASPVGTPTPASRPFMNSPPGITTAK